MKKIALISETFYPSSLADAVRMKSFADALMDATDCDLHIHSSAQSKGIKKYTVIPYKSKSSSKKGGAFKRIFGEVKLGLELFFRFCFSSYDLIIITSPPFIVALMCSFAARLRGVPFVFDVRDIYPRVYFTFGLLKEKSLIGRFILKLEESIYNHALLVTAATQGILDDIAARVKKPDHIKLIRNGYSQMFELSQEKHPVFTIVFHGNIGKLQDMGLLLRLAEKCAADGLKINFHVIGDGGGDELIKKANLPNLKYFGRLPNNQTAKEIAKAHLGVSFRTAEIISRGAFPVKLFEYVGVGIPILVTPVSEGGTYIEQNNLGYQFEPTDFDAIYKKINLLYQDQSLIQQIHQNILQIRPELSREKRAMDFLKLLVAFTGIELKKKSVNLGQEEKASSTIRQEHA